MSRFKASDLLDQKFGDLTVISRAPNGKNGQAQWNCTCSCGGKRIVESARLNDGKIKHCGCKNKTPTPFINLVGEKFGKLIIISREKNNKRSVQYNCRCECGNKRIVFAESLKNGEINSCKTCHVSRKLIDITGQKFGKLTVLSRAPNGKSDTPRWECQCQCGNKVIAQKGQLKEWSSCGCNRKKSFNSMANSTDLTGQKFGKITVISRVEGNISSWNCHCECGKDIIYYYSHLIDDKFTSCGCAFIKQYSDRTLSSRHALYNNYRNSAKRRKLSFELTFEEFNELTSKDCYYCGKKPTQYYKYVKLLFMKARLSEK